MPASPESGPGGVPYKQHLLIHPGRSAREWEISIRCLPESRLGCVSLEDGSGCKRDRDRGERGRARVSATQAAGLRAWAQWQGSPIQPAGGREGDSAVGLPRFPRGNRTQPLLGPHTCLVTQLVKTSAYSVSVGRGRAESGTRSLPAPPQGPPSGSTLHRGAEAADTSPTQSRPVWRRGEGDPASCPSQWAGPDL